MLLVGCASGRTAPLSYACPRAPATVSIDGSLDEWKGAPWTERFRDIEGEKGVPFATRAKLMWDARYLYVAAHLEQPHLAGKLTKRDSVIYKDDDFEVFLDPSGRGVNYFELEINALGTVFDLTLTKAYSKGGKANHGFDFEGMRTAVSRQGTLNDPSDVDRGWTVEIAIPWTAFRGFARPARNDTWRLNFSRVEWPKKVVDGHYENDVDTSKPLWLQPLNWTWSPQWEISMHLPRHWGYLHFR